MHVGGYRETAQVLLGHLAEGDVSAAVLAYEEYYDLYAQLGIRLRQHLTYVGLSDAALECRFRVTSQPDTFVTDEQVAFLDRLAANYASKERLLADAPA